MCKFKREKKFIEVYVAYCRCDYWKGLHEPPAIPLYYLYNDNNTMTILFYSILFYMAVCFKGTCIL